MIKKMKWGGMLVASLLMASSCQNEEIVQNQSAQGQAFTLTASKGMGSRTAIDGDKTVWSEGDKIYVSSKDGKVTGVLTLTDGADDVTGTFSGFVFGNPNQLAYSVYPAPTSGTTLDLSEVAGAHQLDAPMIGKINQDGDVDVQFNHACGVLYANLPGSTGQDFTITATNGGTAIHLAATANVAASSIQWNGEVPSLKFTSPETEIEVTDAKGGIMYIPYYTNEANLTNVTFKVEDTALNATPINLTQDNGPIGKIVQSNILTLTYDNGEYKATTVPEVEVTDGELTISADELGGNIEYINIPTVKDEDGQVVEVESITVELPKFDEQGQTSVISFDEIAEGTTVTIKEDEDASKEHSIKELTVILPSADAPVEIDMPNTTVTIISADSNELVIEEIIVGTADDTFVVTENVYIKKLTVKRGNVEVYGSVDYIGRPANYATEELPETIYVYVIDNGKVGSIGEGVSFASNMSGVVSNAAQLMEALNIQAGDRAEITLVDDIVLTETAVVLEGTNVTLNLNGKTISGNVNKEEHTDKSVINNEGTLKLVGGAIKNTSTNGDAVIRNSGSLVLDGVKLEGAPIADGSYPAYAVYTSGSLVVEEGTEITSDRGAISLQNGANVTINGGNINVTDALGTRVLTTHVIYASGSESKLTINDGNFAMNYNAAANTGASVICPAGATIKVYGGNFTYLGTVGQSGIFQNYMGYGAPIDVYGGIYSDDTVTKSGNLAEGYKATLTKGSWVVTSGDITPVSSVEELATAVGNGAANLYLLPGEYDVKNCGSKTLTISGSKEAVLKVMNEGEDGCDYGFDSSNVTFNGVTINTISNNGSYKGYARLTATYNDCDIIGSYTTHQVQTFNSCNFDTKNGYIWTWGATEVTFDGCEFGTNSKAILAHGWVTQIINIRDCKFNAVERGYANSGKDWTAAVEIDPAGENTYTINFEGNNTKTENYAGWTRIKDGSTGHTITGVK